MTATMRSVGKKLLCRIFVQTQRDLDLMTCEYFEWKPTHHYLEHGCHMPDEVNHVLATVDIIDALDKAFVTYADQ